VIDGVFAVGEEGQVHFAEAAALTAPELVTRHRLTPVISSRFATAR
jgi:hypothetical protein